MLNETFDQRVAREKAEAIIRTRNLFALATDIAAHLDDGWHLAPADPDREFELTHPHLRRASDGAELWLGAAWQDKTRVEVHANWPRDARGQEVRPYFSQYSDNGAAAPGITFAGTKTGAQAAKDIARRFLPVFLPLWEKQAATVRNQEDHRTRRASLAARIAETIGGTVQTSRGDEATVQMPYTDGRGIRSVEFGSDDREITVTVRCTLEQLAQLAKIVVK